MNVLIYIANNNINHRRVSLFFAQLITVHRFKSQKCKQYWPFNE